MRYFVAIAQLDVGCYNNNKHQSLSKDETLDIGSGTLRWAEAANK